MNAMLGIAALALIGTYLSVDTIANKNNKENL